MFCIDRPFDFIICDNPVDLEGNATLKKDMGYGCVQVVFNIEVFDIILCCCLRSQAMLFYDIII